MSWLVQATLFTCVAAVGCAQTSPLLDILSEELTRNFEVLRQKSEPPPYYLAYGVTEQESAMLSATAGALTASTDRHNRLLDVTVRVGSPKLDNYHRVRGEQPRFTFGSLLSIDDNPNAIKQALWNETDRVYRRAAERLIKIKTDTQVRLAGEDESDDFSQEEPVRHVDAPSKLKFAKSDWETRVRKWSAQLAKHPGVLNSGVVILADQETKYLVNSEGARLQHGRGFARIVISASGKAADGMNLSANETFEAEVSDRLPKDGDVEDAIDRVGKELGNLLKAPSVEPFVGPAVLSGRAAGVFFHEIFGHRVEGHRQKDETDGQTFTKSVGSPVLPEFLSVVFDPTRRKLENSVDLNGAYLFDDEGVKARRVPVVENGILKTFLMSRTPVQGFPNSNGHGRRQPGTEVVSRQSNLFVESARSVSDKQLREMLIAEVRRQNKPYGLYFQQVTGGFTQTGRRGIQAFKVIPLVVYRVFPDGRPDQLVRGADIVGTPLASFAKILATSDRPEVFNGYCGAESGNVPVSAISPALLISEIEIQKQETSLERPPLLPRPSEAGGPR